MSDEVETRPTFSMPLRQNLTPAVVFSSPNSAPKANFMHWLKCVVIVTCGDPEMDVAKDPKPVALVVEDELFVRMLGMDILESAGFDVLEATTADEAIDVLQAHTDVQLLFSDIDMPGSMNGLALAHVVHDRWPTIRLLLTSGHHQLYKAEIPDAGQFLSKPWTQQALVAKVQATMTAQH